MEDAGFRRVSRAAQQAAALYQTATETGPETNATKVLINNLLFAESKSVRTSTIILASFNVFAALITAFSILYDCYWASKRCSSQHRAEKFCITKIHPAETFPLVLSLGIAIQGCIFAGAQSEGLSTLFVNGCGTIGQLVFPAIFLVPYIQLVFGLECTIRSFRMLPFQARGKYDVTICLSTVLLMTIGTWIPTHLNPEADFCFASLVWFVSRYGVEGLSILIAVVGLSLICALIIYLKVSSSSLIDQHQRIAASRMVYYLILNVVPLAFVIPWFITLTREMPTLTTSMMATVVLNLTGLFNGALHIFLRSNTAATAFGPSDSSGWHKRKHEIRIWGPNELGFDGHLLQPVSGPASYKSNDIIRKEKGLSVESYPTPRYQYVKTSGISPPASPPFDFSPTTSAKPEPSLPSPTLSPSGRQHKQIRPYSLFPTEAAAAANPAGMQLPATTFSPNSETSPQVFKFPTSPFIQQNHSNVGDGLESIYIASDIGLLPPPNVFSGRGKPRHVRNSSLISSATVQIGLRLSHAVPQIAPSLPPTTYNYKAPPNSNVTPPPSALQIKTRKLTSLYPPTNNGFRPATTPSSDAPAAAVSPVSSIDSPSSGMLTDFERQERMKTLPPVPRIQSAVSPITSEYGEEVHIQFSPNAYVSNISPLKPAALSQNNTVEELTRTPSARKVGLPRWPSPSSPRDPLVSSPVRKDSVKRAQPEALREQVQGTSRDEPGWI